MKKYLENLRYFAFRLQDDNAPSNKAILVQEFLTQSGTNITEQAAYSPDLAPCGFLLFPKLRLSLRRRRFEAVEVIKANSMTTFWFYLKIPGIFAQKNILKY